MIIATVVLYLHRVASIIHYGSLPPAILCVLYTAFVLPLLVL